MNFTSCHLSRTKVKFIPTPIFCRWDQKPQKAARGLTSSYGAGNHKHSRGELVDDQRSLARSC
jgi:hypothetical protein